jgi:hypothetical protein
MNRNERRKVAKKGVTHKDLLNLQNEGVSSGINHATKALLACFVMTMHDKWGWGHKRLTRLLDQVNDQFDSVLKEYVSLDDIIQEVKDKLGVDIK